MDERVGRRGRHNNFDVLRLAAAIAVLVSHSFALTRRVEPAIGSLTLGGVGVRVFFGISGYLIIRSWLNDPTLARYARKRALRIYPAYVVVVVLVAFVLGPLVTTLSPGKYFLNSGPPLYVVRNLTLWHNSFALPGVFAHNAYPASPNGSIWTLTYEVRDYIIVAAVGLLGLLGNRWIGLATLVAIAVGASAVDPTGQYLQPMFLRTFVAGSVIYMLGPRLPWRWSIAATGVAVWLALSSTKFGPYVAIIVLPYLSVVAAYKTPASWRNITKRGDFSYGLYLWAFPIQQTTALLIPGIGPVEMIAICLPATYLAAMASWFLVERRALQFKPVRATASL